MKIDSLKDLQKVIALCRKMGVEGIKIGDIELSMGAAPRTNRNLRTVEDFPESSLKIPQFSPVQSVSDTVADVIKTDGLTDDQLLFYSAVGEQEQN